MDIFNKKTWLIVKPKYPREFLTEANQGEFFCDTEVKITTFGRKHLGAAVESPEYREEFITEKIENSGKELESSLDENY